MWTMNSLLRFYIIQICQLLFIHVGLVLPKTKLGVLYDVSACTLTSCPS